MNDPSNGGSGGEAWTTTTTNNLTAPPTRIVGRTEIIGRLAREVSASRLVSIVGAGGIGKTTVALGVAEQAMGAFHDGVWLVDVAPLRDPTRVPNAIASALGLVVHSASIMTALCRFLRDRETLLVLDNCEHLIDAIAPCVTRILEEAPRVHVLTTSRAPMRVPGEQVHKLPGLATPPISSELTAAAALAFPAVELFVERATDRQEGFALGDADAPVVAEICRTLDGIALAIELAAMRVDVFGVRGLQEQLADRFRILGTRRAGLERHRTLAATLDWSYSLLPAREAAVLCAVSVFAGILRVEDARAISTLSAEETATILTGLAAQSLLSVDTDADSGEVLYRPLETTRAYCLEKLVASGDNATIRLRHATYIAEVVERAAHAPTLAIYRRHLDDLRSALAWSGTDPAHHALFVRLTTAGTVLWNHFSLTDESRTHLKRAITYLRSPGAAGTAVEMGLQLALAGALLYTQGIVPEAREAMDRAREIAIQRNDTIYQLNCLRIIGTYELFSGSNDAGIRTLESFVSLAMAEDPAAVAEGETHLGCGEMFVGRLRPARQRLERLHARGLEDAASLRFLYNNNINVLIVLSHAQWLTGSPRAAEETAARVVDYGLRAHHELSLTIGLAWVCLVYLWTGREAECSRYTAMLDDLVERHGIVTWRPTATFCRGALASMHAASRAEGIAYLEQTERECRAIGHKARLPYYLAVLAEALTKHGRLEEAEAKIDEALHLAETYNDNWSLPELLRIRGFVLAARGQPAAQEAVLVKSMELAEQLDASSWRLRTAIDLARLWRAQARTREAKQLLRPVLDGFSEGFETRDIALAAKLLAELE